MREFDPDESHHVVDRRLRVVWQLGSHGGRWIGPDPRRDTREDVVQILQRLWICPGVTHHRRYPIDGCSRDSTAQDCYVAAAWVASAIKTDCMAATVSAKPDVFCPVASSIRGND
jgi:hypothetical protein